MKRFLRWLATGVTILILVLAVAQVVLLQGTAMQPIQATNRQVKYSHTPTLLIPGWGGNSWTYHKLIADYQADNVAQNAMVVNVTPTGKVHVQGKITKQANPMIQVLFDWNYSTTYHPQVWQLTKVLQVLHDDYHINRVNVIAHSYGGTEFLHAVFEHPELQRQIGFPKVILLGVPVEESFGSHTKFNQWLFKKSHDRSFKRLYQASQHLALKEPMHIYNWLGLQDESHVTDGQVPLIEALMTKSLINNPQITYEQRVFKHTSHIELHDKEHILNAIQQILWGQPTKGVDE
ncbi:alpha/beta hydrolase [Limosilactobacillus equigenerosi]|uniref:Alpha beta hydrolase superfamily protein n=1 Tax=Limosilactobacillus equigenerosi DSM 18793 = JCM 14505 TaxID=1423742 RepID=A0A0R1UT52_9LACO|nr:alpha/beta hydrolase [Limosilactobacillus equigenerosi]KRL96368.1 hypothetical protein FC21_GL000167 [Limosilactobacillus equigenerosi DSM 18793 = JCM 14505]